MSIRHLIEDIKSEAIEKFVAELMTELLRQGFTFADVLDALATWSSELRADEVVKKLEELAESVREEM